MIPSISTILKVRNRKLKFQLTSSNEISSLSSANFGLALDRLSAIFLTPGGSSLPIKESLHLSFKSILSSSCFSFVSQLFSYNYFLRSLIYPTSSMSFKIQKKKKGK